MSGLLDSLLTSLFKAGEQALSDELRRLGLAKGSKRSEPSSVENDDKEVIETEGETIDDGKG